MKAADAIARSPVYVLVEGQMTLNATAAQTWPHVINYLSWQNYSIAKHISGEVGKEGEVVLLKKDESGASSTPYYARTIKVEPERRVVWKIFREHSTEGGWTFGIVSFRLDEIDGKTRFSYDLMYEFDAPTADEDELRLFKEQQHRNYQTLLSSILPKLKIRVEENG